MSNTRTRQLALAMGLWLLAAMTPATAQSSLGDLFGDGGSSGSTLPVQEAFAIDVQADGDGPASIRIDIADGYYLYRDSVSATHLGADGDGGAARDNGESLALAFPDGPIHEDEFFGRQPIYRQPVEIPLTGDAPVSAGTSIAITFQGCSDAGVCYPPYRATGQVGDAALDYTINPQAVRLEAGSSSTASGETPTASSREAPAGAGGGEAGRLEGLLNTASLPAILAGFFAAGLLLAFTACLYPMIPILSGLIAGDPHRSGSLRALTLSLVYVESTAITYALAGMAAGMTGAAVQADLQSPWVLGSFAAVFVVLALGMFGAFELRLPTALQTRLTALSNRQRGGTVLGVALMGVLSTLIVGACSGPALIAALVFIGSTGDAWLGGLALFTLANGMGLPLLLIGTAAGRWLPRSGPWMNVVRAIFGVGFLAVALWTLERFLPGTVTLALWGLLLIGCGVWLGGLERSDGTAGNRQRAARTLGLAALIWGTVSLIGAASGGDNVMRPLAGLALSGGASEQSQAMTFRDIDSVDDLESALAEARAADRPVMIDIYADWCVYCVQLEERTFTDPAVQDAVADAVRLRADVTDMAPRHRRLMDRLDVYLPPAIIFYGPEGNERRDARVVGFLRPQPFIERARSGLAGLSG
ncbi:cytochrome C biogenesis protein [Spiribacter roseus]|uniref:protein-disulfide reductase DsbD n=1 Tax=Spiribacter roseus TaxID=1855875 RepID=UPI000F715365|nr:cytochrome C biogenesis protein [Spiribacter roseus]